MRRIAPLLLFVLTASAQVPDMPDLAPAPATATAPADPTPETPAPPAPQLPPAGETSPASLPAPETPAPALRLSFSPDHLSAFYYAKEDARITILIDNPTPADLPLAGNIEFGPRPDPGQPFKALSITPVNAATIGPGQRAKLSVSAAFPAPGEYLLRYSGTDIPAASRLPLRCIFAPRGVDPSSPDAPWLLPVPAAAADTPGLLADLALRTGVRRFILDETWAPAPAPDVSVLSIDQRNTLFADLAAAKSQLILRLALTPAARADARHVAAFNQYVVTFITRGKGTVTALSIDAGNALPLADELERFRDFYLAGYAAAKKADKNILMLGAGSLVNTDMFLIAPPKGEDLRGYVDLAAALATPAELRRAAERAALQTAATKSPLWVLPPRTLNPEPRTLNPEPAPPMPAPALKALGAALIPLDLAQRNVPAHLLGGAVFTERLHPESAPYVAIFQGDGYAVAAIAGLAAGTPLDADPAFTTLLPQPAALRNNAHLTPPAMLEENPKGDPLPAQPFLELSDDTKSMRVVDSRGNPVDCRLGDTLNVPLTNQIVYVLAGGSADELAGLLRTATPHHLPFAAVTVLQYTPATLQYDEEKKLTATNGALKLKLTNLTASPIEGAVTASAQRLNSGSLLGEAPYKLAPNKSAEVELTILAIDTSTTLTVDLTRSKSPTRQRHTLSAPSAR